MFYNLRGRNAHELKRYKAAEEYYLKSLTLVPGRIYPYYLLTKLFADPANYNPEKMMLYANIVLKKKPKVHSIAIDEMRNEVLKIVEETKRKI